MLKVVGCLCILVGCIGWGGSRIREEKGRIQHLREIIRIIRRIQNEISYGRHTMPEICLILSENCRMPYQAGFRAIYERTRQPDGVCLEQIWGQEMALCLQAARLQEEEKEILLSLPQNLGIQEEKFQAENIGQSMDLLLRKCRQAEDAYENKSRVIFSLSILTGVFLAILLL